MRHVPSCMTPIQTASSDELIPKQVRSVAFRTLVLSADSLQLKVFTCQALQQGPLCVLNATLTIARSSRSGSELSELLLLLGAKCGPCPRPPEANSWPVGEWEQRDAGEVLTDSREARVPLSSSAGRRCKEHL